MAYFYRVEAIDRGGLTVVDGVSPDTGTVFSNFSLANFEALVGVEHPTVADLRVAVMDCVVEDALAFTTAIDAANHYWVNGQSLLDQLVALNVDADPDTFWGVNGAALDASYLDETERPGADVPPGAYFRLSSHLFIDDVTPTDPAVINTAVGDPAGLPTMTYLTPRFTIVAVEGVAYPGDPTYPDLVRPDDIGTATKLVNGPVVKTVNRNALLVQEMLELLVDAASDPDQNPTLEIDLNGYRLVDLAEDDSSNAPARQE